MSYDIWLLSNAGESQLRAGSIADIAPLYKEELAVFLFFYGKLCTYGGQKWEHWKHFLFGQDLTDFFLLPLKEKVSMAREELPPTCKFVEISMTRVSPHLSENQLSHPWRWLCLKWRAAHCQLQSLVHDYLQFIGRPGQDGWG